MIVILVIRMVTRNEMIIQRTGDPKLSSPVTLTLHSDLAILLRLGPVLVLSKVRSLGEKCKKYWGSESCRMWAVDEKLSKAQCLVGCGFGGRNFQRIRFLVLRACENLLRFQVGPVTGQLWASPLKIMNLLTLLYTVEPISSIPTPYKLNVPGPARNSNLLKKEPAWWSKSGAAALAAGAAATGAGDGGCCKPYNPKSRGTLYP